jgi:hypothetical protein
MHLSSEHVFHRASSRTRALVGAAGLWLAAGAAEAAIFKNGLIDHQLCCGNGGPLSFDGTPLRGGHSASVAAVAGKSSIAGEPVAAAKPVASASAAPKEIDGFLQIDFVRLSDFKVEAPAYDPNVKTELTLAAVDQQIPAAIKEYGGRQAQVTGFMLPIKMDGQLVSEFLLMRDQMMCCYGITPRLNDWVVVKMQKPVRYTPDVPVAFRGKLQVKTMQEQGFITGIYQLDDAMPGKL